MFKRIITAAVALLMFIPILFFSDTIVFDIAIALIAVTGTIEFLQCEGLLKIWIISIPSIFFSFIILISVRTADIKVSVLFFIVYLFILFFSLVFAEGKHKTSDVATAFFSTTYVMISFISILITRSLKYGEYLYILIFAGAWTTDTFAYFCGKFFGKHKLMPEISPKKTIEGAVGGVIFCIAVFNLFGYIVSEFLSENIIPDYLLLSIVGLITALLSQLGDLCASAIKRNYGIKDYGYIFPGHGGILDRFDSVMAAAPFILCISVLLSKTDLIGLFK